MKKEEEDRCPKDNLPKTGTRTVRGVENGICGNGHNWPLEAVREQRHRAERAKDDEIVNNPHQHTSWEIEAARRRRMERYRNGEMP